MARSKQRDVGTLGASFGGCLATSARMIDRVIAGTYDEALRPLGIRSTQATLLVFIARAQRGDERATARDLVQALCIDQTTLSRNIARLVEKGLVRALESEDARLAPLELTAKGRATLEKALPIWRGGQAHVRRLLGEQFADDLAKAAAKLSTT